MPGPKSPFTSCAAAGLNIMKRGSVKVRTGRPQFVWLNRLVTETLSSGRKRPTGNARKTPKSKFQTDGWRNWLRPLVPKPSMPVPVGCEKIDGSYHGSA